MSAAAGCKDLEKQDVSRVEDEDVDDLSSTADDSPLEKSDVILEQLTTV